jgi:hypothetical protein
LWDGSGREYDKTWVPSPKKSILGIKEVNPETLDKCVANRATEIIVIPYLLNNGLHIRPDIPEMMKSGGSKKVQE